MQFVYYEQAGEETLSVDSEIHKYLFKIRRHNIDEKIAFRNLKDEMLYWYKVTNISKKEALLQRDAYERKPVVASKSLHIIWSVVDPKTIEKQLPYLNEMGVDKISFFYGKYSQKNFKLNFDKFEKILINSSQQCGRSNIIKLAMLESLDVALEQYPEAYMLNFSSACINDNSTIQTIVIGNEGGFDKSETEKFDSEKIIGLNSKLILRSETAASAVAAKILL